jgi:hypothetical protein
MLTDIQKANIKSFLETDYQLTVQSIHNDKNDNHYKVLCEHNSQKVVFTLVKNRDNDKYRLWTDINKYIFVPKFVEFLDNHEGYQKLLSLDGLVKYSMFSIKQYLSTFHLAESTFLKKQKHVPQFEVMTMFKFSDTHHSIHHILAGVTKFSKNETTFDDYFARSLYTEPRVRPVGHVDYNIQFKNKNDNMKMIQDVLFSNYIRYMNFIKEFKFEHDNINEITQLDHIDAAYRVNANISLKAMVDI